jgi:glycosyltransferase involved in cell wall biosynthesis
MPTPPGKPLITLITVVKNGAQTIERCLKSVQAQRYKHIEYIVLDGASTDGTQAILERYRPLMRCYYSKPDKGAYDATRQGFNLAGGEIVGLLHADDWLTPDACETIAQLYLDHPQAEMFCFAMQEHRLLPDGRILPTRIFLDPPGERFTLADGLYCHGVNRFYRRDVIERFGRFREDRYVQMADRDMYARMGEAGLIRARSEKILYHFLVHPNSNSTGGDRSKIVYFLQETAQIARDMLAEGPPASCPAPQTRELLLTDWYCFNQLRAAWFLLRCGRLSECRRTLWELATRYPRALVRNLLDYRMPPPYRPAAVRSGRGG